MLEVMVEGLNRLVRNLEEKYLKIEEHLSQEINIGSHKGK